VGDALLETLRRLQRADFAWWLYSSAALAVRGLPVAPGDIDLHVDDPFAAARLFDDVLITPVERLDGWAAADVGRAFLRGAVVEWLAAPPAALDDPHEQGPSSPIASRPCAGAATTSRSRRRRCSCA
jgi:hypothetical protein